MADQTSTLKGLEAYFEAEIRRIIDADEMLRLQFALLESIANALNTEAHIKGGFTVLRESYLSETKVTLISTSNLLKSEFSVTSTL